MNKLKTFWPFLLIAFVVAVFFFPVFKGQIPFPGDILVGDNPYKTESYLGYAPGGYPNKAQGPDVTKEIYPWRYFSIGELKKGILPFWNPHNFSGNPQLANFQTAVFYPFNVFYLLLPFNYGWSLLIMLQPLLAGFFMYLFLKKGIGLKNFPSVVGGISFAFSSYMVVWMEYANIGSTLLWFPLILLFIKNYFKKESALNFLGIVISFCLSFLAGYIQGVFYIFVISFFYYSFLVFTTKGAFQNHKKNLLFLLSLVLPFLITAFQILPTLQLFSQSTRGAYSLLQIEKNLAPIFYWITAFFPDFFGNPATRNYWLDGTYIERVMYPGAVVLFFAFYALFNKIKIQEKGFFIGASLVSLIIATNIPLVKYFYLIPIPVISTTVATREFSVLIFSLIVLGAIGLNHFLNEKEFKKIFAFAYFLGFVFVWAITFLLPKISQDLALNLKVSQHNLIVPTVLLILIILAVFLKRINKNITFILILGILCFDLLFFFNKITPFSSQKLIYPQTPVTSFLQQNAGIYRYWGYGSAYISANYQTVDKTYSPEGNDPLHISSYGELLASSTNGKLPQVLPRPDANVAPGYGSSDLKDNFYRQRVLNLLGIKYVLNQDYSLSSDLRPDESTFPKNSYSLIWQKAPWQIYENKEVLPRFFLSNNYKVGKRSEILDLIYSKDIDLGKTILLEEKPEIEIGKDVKGEVKLLSYDSNKLKFSVTTNGNSLFFISDNYYPEWEASIDEVKTKVQRADYSFRAVAVPAGEHTLVFSYNPVAFIKGLIVSGVGLVLLLSILLVRFYEKKK